MYQAISQAYVGKSILELPTPALLLDLDVLDANIAKMMESVKGTHCQVRPHIKAHKSPSIAHLQMEAGANGITCAKLGEAEVMVNCGLRNILLANQVVGSDKINVLCGLNRYADVMPALDDAQNARDISAAAQKFGVTIPVMIEVDNGLNRSGVRTVDEAIALVDVIQTLPNLVFKGIQAYEGAFRGQSWEEKQKIVDENVGFAVQVKRALIQKGHPVEILSCASTGTWKLTADFAEVTELQPGSYALMETAYYQNDVEFPFKPALMVMATLCSAYKDRMVLDAGKKAIPYDQGIPLLLDDPAAKIAFHEEHCLIDTTEKLRSKKIGDKLFLSPSHCCTTINQHDFYFCMRKGIVEAIWPIYARGRYD